MLFMLHPVLMSLGSHTAVEVSLQTTPSTRLLYIKELDFLIITITRLLPDIALIDLFLWCVFFQNF
jgi:hypothetical protein